MSTTQGREYDVVVIGSGPIGRTASIRTAKHGLSVAILESELVGGDCHYWACIPSKALLRPAETLAETLHVEGSRQAVGRPLDVEEVFERRNRNVDYWDDGRVTEMLTKNGVQVLKGRGTLIGVRRVKVATADGKTEEIGARHAVVVATGSRTFIPPSIPGLRESKPWTNRNATGAKRVPKQLAILGGGPVACEMATAWNSFGSKVTVIERGPTLLAKCEPFVGEMIAQEFTRRRIDVRTHAEVERVRRIEEGGEIEIVLKGGERLVVDALLAATGRVPNTDALGLDSVGLSNGGWLDVDDSCRVRGVEGEWLYAIGDVNRIALMTHMGKYQARVCAADIVSRARAGGHGKGVERGQLSFDGRLAPVPQVIFTDPEVAIVGLTDREAREKGLKVRSVDCEIGKEVDGAKLHTDGYEGRARLVIDEERKAIVGATFVGPQVGDLLHAATVAIVGEIPLDRLWRAIPSFPTVSEVWLSLLENYGF